MTTTYITLPVSNKVLLKIANSGTNAAEVLEKWASDQVVPFSERKKATEKKIKTPDPIAASDKTIYMDCKRHNQRIAQSVCFSRIKNKKRGCGSCKTGKTLMKIQELQEGMK
jgi:uncharacterized protein (DUF1697 family)